MSFDDDEDKFGNKDFNEEDLEDMSSNRKEKRDVEDDFFKDEDFEFEDQADRGVESEGFRTKRMKQKKRRRRAVFKIVGIMLILVVIAVAVVFWGIPWIKSLISTEVEIPDEERINIPSSLELTQDMNIVIACADQDLLEPEVSSIMFSRYYSIEEKLITLCIPVKTLLDVPGIGAGLVGESVEVGGMDLLSLTLERNLGMDMEVNNYILMDIYNVVNKLNGVNLELDEEMTVKNYDDNSTFELEEGENLIDGTEALNFLKFFSGMERDIPIGNVTKQKLLLDAVIKKIVGENEEELSANLNLINDFIDTDLSMEEELEIFSTFSEIEPDKDKVYPLDVSLTELAEEEIVYVVEDISGLAEIFGLEEAASKEVTGFTDTIVIRILNGAYDYPGAGGLAANTSKIFEDLKFENGKNKYEILEPGNEENKGDYETTQILVYSQDENSLAAADEIKEVLGVGNIETRENGSGDVDIIIILGKDYLDIVTGPSEEGTEDELIKVIVLNGSGTVSGIAHAVSDILEDHFNDEEKVLEMLEATNADNYNYTQTEINIFSNEAGVIEIAQEIQERLGMGIINYPDNNVHDVDISVILGSDFADQW
jgi:anionic cell wall polymer biosynthesis LytR-Cps2A-Psr (LCP) family protein